ncbi:MAG: hypothetical protein WC551_09955 [Patescibacteria group bacterium]
MQGLYCLHAQVLSAVAYPSTKDIYGNARPMDVETLIAAANLWTTNPYYNNRWVRSVLQASGPGGRGRAVNLNSDINSCIGSHYGSEFPGYLNGIVIGTDNTPAAPTDYFMGDLVVEGSDGAVAPGTKMDSLETGDDHYVNETNYVCSGFSQHWHFWPKKAMLLSSVDLKGYRTNAPGVITLNIYETHGYNDTEFLIATATADADGWTTDVAGDWYNFPLAAPVRLYPGIAYRFELTGTLVSPNCAYFRYKRYAAGDDAQIPSQDVISQRAWNHWTSGSTYYWIAIPMYKLNGSATPEINYGACGIENLVLAATSSFDIKRLFTNRSGEDISVQECGIMAMGGKKSTTGVGAFPYLIARDVIAPAITLSDDEILAVTYTPTITV